MDYFIARVLSLAVRGELNSWREDLGAKAFGFCLSLIHILGPEEGTKPRKVLMSSEQLESYFEEYL